MQVHIYVRPFYGVDERQERRGKETRPVFDAKALIMPGMEMIMIFLVLFLYLSSSVNGILIKSSLIFGTATTDSVCGETFCHMLKFQFKCGNCTF